jgi:hypothetical protein
MKIETVTYRINWAKFHKGASFFIPCIDDGAARKQIARVTKRLGLNVVSKVVVNDGIKGIRVWRE